MWLRLRFGKLRREAALPRDGDGSNAIFAREKNLTTSLSFFGSWRSYIEDKKILFDIELRIGKREEKRREEVRG
jgi:hypothetical protein